MGAFILFVVAVGAFFIQGVISENEEFIIPSLPSADPPLTPEELKALAKTYERKRLSAREFPGKDKQPNGAGSVEHSKIVGGSITARGIYSWQVNLNIDASSLCGGSLLSANWIITAAHCVSKATNLIVTLGSQDTAARFEEGRAVMHTNSKIVHAQYDSTRLLNDIALVRLLTSIGVPNKWFNAIRLPKQSDVTKAYENVVATACGRGRTGDSSPSITTLKCVNLTVISNTECARTFGSYIQVSTLCVQTNYSIGAQSVCQGDSGGPLAVKEADGIWTLIGVTSFVNAAGCESRSPAGFARVTSFLSWISQNSGIAIRT